MKTFTTADGPALRASGLPMLKKPNPVWMNKQKEPFLVETNEGPVTGKAGDFVAHDPMSGHVWPVAADYVEQHYEYLPGVEVIGGAV